MESQTPNSNTRPLTTVFSEEDLDLAQHQWTGILEAVSKLREDMLELPKSDRLKARNIILEYVKQHHRIVYGGVALNLLLKQKNPAAMIYSEDDDYDIDFYSPDPINDCIRIANELYAAGLPYVRADEAQHEETFKIKVHFNAYCDITYIPRLVEGKMATTVIDGIRVVQPNFAIADPLRILSDPISWWRLVDKNGESKLLKRLILLQTNYPVFTNYSPITLPELGATRAEIMDKILKFMTTKKTLVCVGIYALNHLIAQVSEASDVPPRIPVNFIEIISANYKTDVQDLLEILYAIRTDNVDGGKFCQTEYYPYFQFTGYSVKIFYEKMLIAHVYDHNMKCIIYQEVPAISFDELIPSRPQKTIRIGSYSTILLYAIIQYQWARTMDKTQLKNFYYKMAAEIIYLRNYYLRTANSNIFSDSLFKEFSPQCIGKTIKPELHRNNIIESRSHRNQPLMFRYIPSADKIREPDSDERFNNSSGNVIANPKNLVLLEYAQYKCADDLETSNED